MFDRNDCFQVMSGWTIASAMLLSLSTLVAHAEESIPQFTPNDPYFELQWNLDSPVRAGGQAVASPLDHPDADIDMPEAWALWNEIPIPQDKAYVALIGTGVQTSHVDLHGHFLNPGEDANGDGIGSDSDFNGRDDDGNGYPDDIRGWNFNGGSPVVNGGSVFRGTHRAGIVGAHTDEFLRSTCSNKSAGVEDIVISVEHPPTPCGHGAIAGIHGLRSNLRMIALQIEGGGASGEQGFYAFNEAAHYVADLKMNRGVSIVAAVVDPRFQAVSTARDGLDALRDAGILTILPAQHSDLVLRRFSGQNIDESPFPGIAEEPDPNILTVAATDRTGRLTSWSNWGPISVDVAAPGVDIWSTTSDVGGYGPSEGTGASAAHVAGLAALLWSYDSTLRSDDPDPDGDGPLTGKPSYLKIKERILNTVVKDPSLEGKTVTGGRINAWRALANRTDIDP